MPVPVLLVAGAVLKKAAVGAAVKKAGAGAAAAGAAAVKKAGAGAAASAAAVKKVGAGAAAGAGVVVKKAGAAIAKEPISSAGVVVSIGLGLYANSSRAENTQTQRAENMQALRNVCKQAQRNLEVGRCQQPHGKNIPPICNTYRGGKSAYANYEEFRFEIATEDVEGVNPEVARILLWIKIPFDDLGQASVRYDYVMWTGERKNGNYKEYDPEYILQEIAPRPLRPR